MATFHKSCSMSQRLNLMTYTDIKWKSCPPHIQTCTSPYVSSLLAPNANKKIPSPDHNPKQRHQAYNYWELLASPPKKCHPSESTSKSQAKNSIFQNSTSQHTCPSLAPTLHGQDQHMPLLTAPKHLQTTWCYTQLPSPLPPSLEQWKPSNQIQTSKTTLKSSYMPLQTSPTGAANNLQKTSLFSHNNG